MLEYVETAMSVCAFAVVGLLLLLIIGFYAVAVYKGASRIVHRLRRGRAFIGLLAVAAVAIIHGGTKNILNRFSADDGITVTSAEFMRATNDVERTRLVYSYTGADASWPLWVRQSVSNEWEHLEEGWLLDGRTYAGGTNTVAWSVTPPATNYLPHAMYWVGDNPPPVEIEESGGVEIVCFIMSAQGVAITYAVDGSVLHGKTGALAVETSQGNGPWGVVHEESVTETVTNTVTQGGFFVDRLTRWRVRMEVEK